jgi:hypothetical protein
LALALGTEDVGHTEALRYDDSGQLRITAVIDHPEARRAPGLSVAVKVIEYELRDVESKENFHAVINRAEILEISMTDRPAHPDALVLTRCPVHSPAAEFYDIVNTQVQLLGRITQVLLDMQRHRNREQQNVARTTAARQAPPHR